MDRVLLFLVCLLVSAGFGRVPGELPVGTVRVVVQDEAAVAIPGAAVSLAPGAARGETDANGVVEFTVQGGGSFRITVRSEGFFPKESPAITVAPGGTVDVQMILAVKSVVEESIVVTATGTEYLSTEAPIQTDLVTASLVDAQAKSSLADALQATTAGVRTEMNCQNCGFIQLRMNGLEGPYSQILEDGLPSFSGVAAVYGLEQIPAAFVEQIEVVKGGNSALYGPNAVAGVVNLIRREPVANQLRVDLLQGWHRGRPEATAGASAQLVELPLDFSVDLYYRGLRRTPVDRDGDGFTEFGKRQLHSGGASAYRNSFSGTGRLALNVTDMGEFRRGGNLLERPPDQTDITEMAETRRTTASARWSHAIDANNFYSAKLAYARLERESYYGSGFDPNAYGSTHNPLAVGDLQYGRQQSTHTLLAGYQVWNEEVMDLAPAYNRVLGGSFRNQGVYLQDEWRARRSLTLIGGMRADWANTVKGAVLSPRAGIRAGVGKGVTVRASVSTGFRAPGVFDEDLHIAQVGGEGFLMQNAADLREERSVSFSASVDLARNWRGQPARISGGWFSTQLDGVFTLEESADPVGGFRQLYRINGGGARVSGVEASGDLRVSRRLGFRSGFTWQLAHYSQPEPQFGSMDFFRTPNRYGFLSAEAELPLELDLVATADHTGRMRVPHYAGYIDADRLEHSRSFLVMNLVLSRTFRISDRQSLRLFVNAQNAGDAYQPDLDRGPLRDSAYVYGPVEMRRVVVGTTWQF